MEISFSEPWKICNNCKQPFQNQLSIDLASAFVSFAEATYGHPGNSKWDKLKVLSSLSTKIELALSPTMMPTDKNIMIVEGKKMLSIIDQTKKDLKMSGWIHMPKGSEEYEYYKALCGNYEAYAHQHLGIASFTGDFSDEESQIAIGHIKKTRAIYSLLGMKEYAKQMDMLISLYTTNDPNINSSSSASSMMQSLRNCYDKNIIQFGMNSESTMRTGLHYAILLWNMNHCIEAERLVAKITTNSRRVLGPHHKVTIEADEFLIKCKERSVTILPQNKQFQALRYKNDGEICVVTGPVAMPRNLEDERVYHVDSHLVIPNKGCPVLCHGLVSAPHLNGELGEVRNWKQSKIGIRLAVHFEKKGVKSALVKPENLRIAFELPSEESFELLSEA